MAKKNKLAVWIVLLLIFFSLITAWPIQAEETGEPIVKPESFPFTANIPIGDFGGCVFVANQTSDCLGNYLKAWYGFMVGTVGILATIMIMYAGFKYLTSRGDNKEISNAKEIIIAAISGIAIALLSYTILNIINPNLLTIRMPTLESFETEGWRIDSSKSVNPASIGTTNQGSASAPNPPFSELDARELLTSNGIRITSTGNCSDCNNPKCTCIGGLSGEALDSAVNLSTSCGDYNLTGGTETGHHYGCSGNCYDIGRDNNIDNCITTEGTRVENGTYQRGYQCSDSNPCYEINNTFYWREDGRHWHAHTSLAP